MNENLAPVVLFVYNRPEHTQHTINALKKNQLARKTDLFIFCDAPKNPEDTDKVKQVRNIISNVSGFKNISVQCAQSNKGLACSIIEGVNEIINIYGKVIVLEDDLITSSFFLKYMNEALDTYITNERIWSISGYTPNIKFPTAYEEDIYMAGRGCSWGWATWKERWNSIDWEMESYYTFIKNRNKKKEFNEGGNDLTYMLKDQIFKRIDSWAIRWVYNQFIQGKYTIYPTKSLVKNIGTDASGTHSSSTQKYDVYLYEGEPYLPEDISVNPEIKKSFKEFYDLNLIGYIGVLSRKFGIYLLLKKLRKQLKI
ncbi:sugar transferase [Priestia megaterium]|uniref:sugar transferase n=1 Tax=Priestia megaterium TaxID=1404 RepID=UPI0006800D3F|nr:sugar transferase [Priestia megaterium]KNH16809.1 sugar transferase [Priestia megaterium]